MTADNITTAPFPRDVIAAGAVLGFASAAWFSWGSGLTWGGLTPWTIALMVLGICVGTAAVFTRRGATAGSVHDSQGYRAWWLWFGVEVALIIGGNIALTALGHPEYQMPWTFLVMALHFIPLARTYRMRSLIVIAALGALVAIVAAVLQATGTARASLVVGLVGGGLLLLSAVALIVQGRQLDRARG